VTATETPTAALLSQQKNRKASPVPGTSGNVVLTIRNDDMMAYGTEECRYITGRSTENKYFQFKLLPTADDKQSATVLLSEPTARKYKECWFGVSAEMKGLRCSVVLWMTSYLGNLRWIDGYRKRRIPLSLSET